MCVCGRGGCCLGFLRGGCFGGSFGGVVVWGFFKCKNFEI